MSAAIVSIFIAVFSLQALRLFCVIPVKNERLLNRNIDVYVYLRFVVVVSENIQYFAVTGATSTTIILQMVQVGSISPSRLPDKTMSHRFESVLFGSLSCESRR